jgi:hypothetical protein
MDDLERQVRETMQDRCRHDTSLNGGVFQERVFGRNVGQCSMCRSERIAAALRAAISTAEALASPMDVERAITISFLAALKGGGDG